MQRVHYLYGYHLKLLQLIINKARQANNLS